MKRIKSFMIKISHKKTLITLLADVFCIFWNKGLPMLGGVLLAFLFLEKISDQYGFWIFLFLIFTLAIEIRFEDTREKELPFKSVE